MNTHSSATDGSAKMEAYPAAPESLFTGASRLCPSLNDVLFAQDALPHLIDFMEDRNILHFLRFWLDCEQFYRICAPVQLGNCGSQDVQLKMGTSTSARDTSDNTERLAAAVVPLNPPILSAKPSQSLFPTAESERVPTSSGGGGDSKFSPVRPNDFKDLRMKPSPSTRRFSKDIQDNAVRIFSQYISLEAPESVGIDNDMRTLILDNMCQEHEKVGIDCFRAAQDKVYEMLSAKVFVDFLSSFHFLRYKSGLILSDRISLADILNYNRTLERFVESVEEVGGVNFVRFVLAAVQYEAQWSSATLLGQYNADWAQTDAMAIYNSYISMQATRPIDLADGLRIAVEESICSEQGVPVNCFRRAVDAVYHHLSAVYLPGFFKSQPFMAYLLELDKELKKTMVASGIIPAMTSVKRRSKDVIRINRAHQRSSSVVAADRLEEPQQDTFSSRTSTMGSASSENGRQRTESECDSRSSHSLDLSGTTSRLRKMAMGEIDALGRFVSYSEPEPVNRQTGILSRTVRKLNRSDEIERRKEQAALDAQRIIEDTLSMSASTFHSL
ncbi:putative A-kinase anchor protein 10, mitochondrial [Hypsibius exemplaris]|uniref:A-kinase anchor protein 10, mitochondrial n=1 Tax=Hypsibius exemplaris TaxID=2072580 RepID=A0A1W0WQP2_HYPEX|nr:putative A-kinase anchor protein 10, mitochondrial [Hypsibius exemplaris]